MAIYRNQYHYSVRRARKQAELFKAEKLLEASMMSNIALLKEMKKIRSGGGGRLELSGQVDGSESD